MGEDRQNKVEKNWVHIQEEFLQENSREQKRISEDNLPKWKNLE